MALQCSVALILLGGSLVRCCAGIAFGSGFSGLGPLERNPTTTENPRQDGMDEAGRTRMFDDVGALLGFATVVVLTFGAAAGWVLFQQSHLSAADSAALRAMALEDY